VLFFPDSSAARFCCEETSSPRPIAKPPNDRLTTYLLLNGVMPTAYSGCLRIISRLCLFTGTVYSKLSQKQALDLFPNVV